MIRPKKRYIAFRVISEERATTQNVLNEILRSTKQAFGELVVAKMNLRLISFDEDTQLGVIRGSNNFSEHLRVSLILINSLGGKKAFFYTTDLSGSLKKLRTKENSQHGFEGNILKTK